MLREASCLEMHAKTSFALGKTMAQLWVTVMTRDTPTVLLTGFATGDPNLTA